MKKLKEILELSAEHADTSELFYMKTFTDELIFRANKLEGINSNQNEGIGLRLRKNGKTGFATSTKITEDIIEKALNISEFGEKSSFNFAGTNIACSENHCDEITFEIPSLIEKGEHIINKIRGCDNKLHTDVFFLKISEETSILIDRGFCGTYKKNNFSTFIGTSFTGKDDMFSIWNEYAGKIVEEKIINDIVTEIPHALAIDEIESGLYPAMFSPGLTGFFMLLFFNGVNGEAIYRKTSPLTGKLNHEIFDKRITIYDDGTINGAFNSCPFDDEGIMSQKTLLVEKGFLKNFLTDIEYSGKLNMAPTGNGFRTKGMMSAYRSYKMYPAIRPSTMVMEPGTTSEADLISNIKKGVLIKNIKDFPVDPNGDFSGVSERAYKIVNGKITGRVKNLKIRGNIYNLFKDKLLAISSDVEISEEFRLPYMLFKDVEIMC